jgi:long-subunit acyl-CoA synthetase (AMP-forming)
MKEYYKNPEKSVETIKKGWLYTDDTAKMDNEGFIYPVDGKKEVIISYTGQKIFIQRK